MPAFIFVAAAWAWLYGTQALSVAVQSLTGKTGGPELSDVAPRPVRGYYQPQK